MAAFLYLFDEGGVSPAILSDLTPDCLAVLPFIPDATKTTRREREAFWSFACDSALSAADEQASIAEGAFSALSGYAWRIASGCAQRLTAHDVSRVCPDIDDLSGEYSCFASIEDNSSRSFADPLGVEHIYYCSRGGRLAVSNRIFLIEAALGSSEIDFRAAAWMTTLGYMFGESTYRKGILRLPAAHVLETNRSKVRLRRLHPLHPLTVPPGWSASVDQFEAAREDCIARVKAIHAKDGPIELAITGGKDSRAVLALHVAAGLQDRLRLYTNGSLAHPDVQIGQKIAHDFGIPHNVRGGAPTYGVALRSPDELLTDFAAHAFQAEGLLGAWDLHLARRRDTGMVMAGLVGETLRGYSKADLPGEQYRSLRAFVSKGHPYDPLGLVNPAIGKDLDQEADDTIKTWIEMGVPPEDIPDYFYTTQRVPNWVGALRKLQTFMRQVVNPLNSPKLHRLAFSLTPLERRAELIHFKIIESCCPRLLPYPFAQQRWNPVLEKYGADRSVFQDPCPAPRSDTIVSWQYSMNLSPSIRLALLNLIDRNAQSPMFEIIDKRRLREALSSEMIGFLPLISLYGWVTSFFTAHRIFTPLKMLADGQSAKPVPVIKTEATAGVPVGQVDLVNELGIHGWAWEPTMPNMPVHIQVFADGKPIAHVAANRYWPSLEKAGIGNGRHGFLITSVTLPKSKAFVPIELKILHSGTPLKNGKVQWKTALEKVNAA